MVEIQQEEEVIIKMIDLRCYPVKYMLIGPKYYHFETKRHRKLIQQQRLTRTHFKAPSQQDNTNREDNIT